MGRPAGMVAPRAGKGREPPVSWSASRTDAPSYLRFRPPAAAGFCLGSVSAGRLSFQVLRQVLCVLGDPWEAGAVDERRQSCQWPYLGT